MTELCQPWRLSFILTYPCGAVAIISRCLPRGISRMCICTWWRNRQEVCFFWCMKVQGYPHLSLSWVTWSSFHLADTRDLVGAILATPILTYVLPKRVGQHTPVHARRGMVLCLFWSLPGGRVSSPSTCEAVGRRRRCTAVTVVQAIGPD
jgi:hypothetical protein